MCVKFIGRLNENGEWNDHTVRRLPWNVETISEPQVKYYVCM